MYGYGRGSYQVTTVYMTSPQRREWTWGSTIFVIVRLRALEMFILCPSSIELTTLIDSLYWPWYNNVGLQSSSLILDDI